MSTGARLQGFLGSFVAKQPVAGTAAPSGFVASDRYASSSALETAHAAASNSGKYGLVDDAGSDPQVYESDGSSWLPTSPAGFVSGTTFASSSALETAHAAASNSGKYGLVDEGGADPRVYESDGSSWSAVSPLLLDSSSWDSRPDGRFAGDTLILTDKGTTYRWQVGATYSDAWVIAEAYAKTLTDVAEISGLTADLTTGGLTHADSDGTTSLSGGFVAIFSGTSTNDRENWTVSLTSGKTGYWAGYLKYSLGTTTTSARIGYATDAEYAAFLVSNTIRSGVLGLRASGTTHALEDAIIDDSVDGSAAVWIDHLVDMDAQAIKIWIDHELWQVIPLDEVDTTTGSWYLFDHICQNGSGHGGTTYVKDSVIYEGA